QLPVPQVERVEEPALHGEAVELGAADAGDHLVLPVLADAHDAAIVAPLGRVHDAVWRGRDRDQPAPAERRGERARTAVRPDADHLALVRRGEHGARVARRDLVDVAAQLDPRLDRAVRRDAVDAAAPVGDEDGAVRERGGAVRGRRADPLRDYARAAVRLDAVEVVLTARVREDVD